MSSLLTDQRRNFEISLISALCKLLGIQKLKTSIYHPACNGQERFNHTLVESLRHFCRENEYDWVRWLPLVTFAYNTGDHSVTGTSPWELVFGREARTPVCVEFEEELKNVSHRDHMNRLKRRLAQLPEETLLKIRENRSKRTEESGTSLKEGEQVYCRNFTAAKSKQGKLQPRSEGRYQVVEAISPDYFIRKGRRRRLVHGCHLKPAGGRFTHLASASGLAGVDTGQPCRSSHSRRYVVLLL